MTLTSLSLISVISLSFVSFAQADCNLEIDDFFDKYAPSSKEITVSGQYTKKSSSGEFKSCEISIKRGKSRLEPSWENGKLDPTNGDGGGIWPFGSYPTTQPKTDDYRKVKFYACDSDADGFSMDFIHRDRSGWYRTHRNSLSLRETTDGTFEVSLRDGQDSTAIICRGILAEKL